MADSIKPFSVSRVFGGWQWMLQRDSGQLVTVFLIWTAISFALYSVDFGLGLTSGLGLLSTTLLAEPLFLGVLYMLALNDDRIGLGQAVGETLNRFFPLLGLYVLTSIGVGIGFLVLILPGIALAVLWCVSFPVLMAERVGPIDAMRASFNTIKNRFWPVLGALIIYGIGVLVIGFLIGLTSSSSFVGEPGLFLALESAVQVVISIAGIYLNVAIFRELGFTGSHDLSVFD